MSEAQLSIPRKRPDLEQPTHVSKRQEPSHASGFRFPPAFWDNLSKIDLTRRALEELDRRNTQAALESPPPCLPPTQQITRCGLAELMKSSQPLISPTEYLRHCETSELRSIEWIARHGGPDLSDLIGVRRRRITVLQTDRFLVSGTIESSKFSDELVPVQVSLKTDIDFWSEY